MRVRLLFLSLFALSFSAFAQSDRGTITGTIADPAVNSPWGNATSRRQARPAPASSEKGYHTPMPENAKGRTVVYLCECGRKWRFSKAELGTDSTQQCKCGRTIVVSKGAIYSTRKR